MKQVIQVLILFTVLGLGFSTAFPQTATSSYTPTKGESLVSYDELHLGIKMAPKLLSEYKREGKRMSKLVERVNDLQQKNAWGATMRAAVEDLRASYQRLVDLRAKMAVVVLGAHQMGNCKSIAENFGWTKAQIAEIDGFKEIAFRIFHEMSEQDYPADEYVLQLLDHLDQSMQARLVFYTSRFYL